MRTPSKYPWFQVTSVLYRCFERFQSSWQVGREGGVPHHQYCNYHSGDENTESEILSPPYSRFPCNGESWPGPRKCEGGFEAVFLSVCFHCFSLCFRYSSQSSAKIQRQNFRPPNLSRNSLRFRLHHRRCFVTGRWTWCLTITRFMIGVGVAA